MSNLVIGVNTSSHVREERISYGTLREAMLAFQEENGLKACSVVPKNKFNLANKGNRLMIVIKEILPANSKKEPVQSNDIFLGREWSDQIRSKEVAWSSILEGEVALNVVPAREAGIGVPARDGFQYLMCYKPTRTVSEINESAWGLTAESKVTQSLLTESIDVDALLSM